MSLPALRQGGVASLGDIPRLLALDPSDGFPRAAMLIMDAAPAQAPVKRPQKRARLEDARAAARRDAALEDLQANMLAQTASPGSERGSPSAMTGASRPGRCQRTPSASRATAR